jgi:pimeloyl-ACP methyl ester carboxylesterase
MDLDRGYGFLRLHRRTVELNAPPAIPKVHWLNSGEPPTFEAMAPHRPALGICLHATLVAIALLCASGCTFRDIRKNAPGVYALEPVDERRIPILFVHGINDSPARFSYLMEHLDRRRFQPWVYSYSSNEHLASVADDLYETVREMRQTYRFRSLAVVGHSMGGLVSRGFILRNERSAPSGEIPLFVSISTPWDGHAGAARGVRFSPSVAKVWYDMTPGSEYLRSLFETPLPAGTRHYLLFTFHRKQSSFGESGDRTVTVASQLAVAAQHEAARVFGFDDTHVGILQNPELASLLNRLLNETFPATGENFASSSGSGTSEVSTEAARTEGQRDHRDPQDDRVGRNDPQKRQRSRSRPGENQHAERDRHDSREDEPELASYFLAKPDCAEDFEETRRDGPERHIEEKHESRHRRMQECENAHDDSGDAREHQQPPVLLLLATGKSGDEPDRTVDKKDRPEDQRQGDE